MEVDATLRQRVEISPVKVLEKLKEEVLGNGEVSKKEDGTFWHFFEVSRGTHSGIKGVQITEEFFQYITSLDVCIRHLKLEIRPGY